MNTLIFATNNQHKVDEIKLVIGTAFQVISLKEAGIQIDIDEPFDTLEENARVKSKTIYELTGQDCFSEDTGLEVDALNGAPGVKSARYAGDSKNPNGNIEKVLNKLGKNEYRAAKFRTVISLIFKGQEHQFEGICSGVITEEKRGSSGFGYDAVFVPDGSTLTFAEMTISEKNRYSHREKATASLLSFLSTFGK